MSDSTEINLTPKEIYGSTSSNNIVRLTNGGGGDTGILKHLAQNYIISKFLSDFVVYWYQNISNKGLEILKNGLVDIGLLYEPNEIKLAVDEGKVINHGKVFDDHFLLIGPKNNPADIKPDNNIFEAFQKLAAYGIKNNTDLLFLSRDDRSSTNVKERSIWDNVSLSPDDMSWYYKHRVFPSAALLMADELGLYSLTDLTTWLTNGSKLSNSVILVRGEEILLNPCYIVTGIKPSENVLSFIEYLKSQECQDLISKYGIDAYGEALFESVNNNSTI
jgi:ABC-type tungstate transport system permease subunit